MQHTIATGATTSDPYGAVGLFAMITNAPSVSALNDRSFQLGGSVGIPSPALTVSMGGEFDIIDAGSKYYYGVTGILGITTTPGGEVHSEWGYTRTIVSFNFFDALFG